ncbi:MAG: hypothetical protein K2X50_03255 [Gammaproteobacteria bacterium]|nr:hypothetical protein [Gammaproteobacteria bacterium]
MIDKAIPFFICSLLMMPSFAYPKPKNTNTHPLLIGYYQNFKNPASSIRLTDVPRGYSIVNIAFATVNTNGTVVFNLQAPAYKGIVNSLDAFKEDIQTLQNRGIKVILSIGGGSSNSSLHVDNEKKANEFVQSLEKIIDDYGFNGIDYDLESKINSLESTYLLNVTQKLHDDYQNKGDPLLFTVAPDAVDVHWQTSQGKYDRVINSGLINLVSVQLYNTTCKRSYKANSPCYEPGTQDFIVSQADSTIQSWKKRGITDPDSKYVIGLPATKRAANRGYADPTVIKKALACLKNGEECAKYTPSTTYPNLGGVMTWSINWDAKDDYLFVDTLLE